MAAAEETTAELTANSSTPTPKDANCNTAVRSKEKGIVTQKILEKRFCRGGCGAKLSRENKSGYCRVCYGRLVLHQAGYKATHI